MLRMASTMMQLQLQTMAASRTAWCVLWFLIHLQLRVSFLLMLLLLGLALLLLILPWVHFAVCSQGWILRDDGGMLPGQARDDAVAARLWEVSAAAVAAAGGK